jgi:hypothetical protein
MDARRHGSDDVARKQMGSPPCFTVKLYRRSRQVFEGLLSALQGAFTGFWLGLLHRDLLHSLDKAYYDSCEQYLQEEYNQLGLWKWEQEAIGTYFRGCKRLLVGGAGGGREVLALSRLGYQVDAFECHPRFVSFANELMKRESLPCIVRLAPRDAAWESGSTYDGVVVGWGSYMLIAEKARRVQFLRQLRAQAAAGAPILLSFFCRSRKDRRYPIIAAVGNLVRWARGRERLELGDDLQPNYVHFFTRDEIASELREAGFELQYFGKQGYGRAVGIAVPESVESIQVKEGDARLAGAGA